MVMTGMSKQKLNGSQNTWKATPPSVIMNKHTPAHTSPVAAQRREPSATHLSKGANSYSANANVNVHDTHGLNKDSDK